MHSISISANVYITCNRCSKRRVCINMLNQIPLYISPFAISLSRRKNVQNMRAGHSTRRPFQTPPHAHSHSLYKQTFAWSMVNECDKNHLGGGGVLGRFWYSTCSFNPFQNEQTSAKTGLILLVHIRTCEPFVCVCVHIQNEYSDGTCTAWAVNVGKRVSEWEKENLGFCLSKTNFLTSHSFFSAFRRN